MIYNWHGNKGVDEMGQKTIDEMGLDEMGCYRFMASYFSNLLTYHLLNVKNSNAYGNLYFKRVYRTLYYSTYGV